MMIQTWNDLFSWIHPQPIDPCSRFVTRTWTFHYSGLSGLHPSHDLFEHFSLNKKPWIGFCNFQRHRYKSRPQELFHRFYVGQVLYFHQSTIGIIFMIILYHNQTSTWKDSETAFMLWLAWQNKLIISPFSPPLTFKTSGTLPSTTSER